MNDSLRCRADSIEAHEPLAGSAPSDTQLVIVEMPGPWGGDAIRQCRADGPVEESLHRLADAREARVLVARHNDRRRLIDHRNIWVLRREGRDCVVEHHQVDHRAAIRWSSDSRTTSGQLLTPVFVCTNGSRDRCCAETGRQLILESSDPDRFWEISHLGGHRFAPTALRSSDGVLFGRLNVAALDEIAGGGARLDLARGRFGRSAAEQVAEIAVARRHDLPLLALDSRRMGSQVEVSTGRREWTATMAEEVAPPRIKSCGREPEEDTFWEATFVR